LIGQPIDISTFPKDLLIPLLLDLFANPRFPEVTLANMTRLLVNAKKGDAGPFMAGGAVALQRALNSKEMMFALLDIAIPGKKKHMAVYVDDLLNAVTWPRHAIVMFAALTLARQYNWKIVEVGDDFDWPFKNAIAVTADYEEYDSYVTINWDYFRDYTTNRALNGQIRWKMFMRLTRLGEFERALNMYAPVPTNDDVRLDAFTKCLMYLYAWGEDRTKYVAFFYPNGVQQDEYVYTMIRCLNNSEKLRKKPSSWYLLQRNYAFLDNYVKRYSYIATDSAMYGVYCILNPKARSRYDSRTETIERTLPKLPRRWITKFLCRRRLLAGFFDDSAIMMKFLFTTQASVEQDVLDILDNSYDMRIDALMEHASVEQLDVIRNKVKNPQTRQVALMLYQSKRMRGEPPLKK
jgi:hypothetical protein